MTKQTLSADYRITTGERELLRELAQKVAEIAAMPVQAKKAEMWTRHNDLERVRPMVMVLPEGSWRELIPENEFLCENEICRSVEKQLRWRIYYWEHLQDDTVISDTLDSQIITHVTGWGLDVQRTPSEMEHGACQFDPVIVEETDADKITIPEVTVDWQATEEHFEFLSDLVGDIIKVEKAGRRRGGICPLDRYSQWRGIDNMFMDLVDKPELVHKVVGKLVDGEISMLKTLEKEGALSQGNGNLVAGSGGTSFTTQLPQADYDGGPVRIKDLWGFATPQIFSEVSPAMHEEFALQHEKRYLELFGLNCYGCCEPLHHKLDIIIKHVPRIRRISISPWADVKISSEKLQNKIIFSWKPNPADLAGEEWEPERIRKQIREFCEITRGNIVEMIMKDTHTVRNQPQRMWEWVKIAKETALDFA